MEDSSHGDNAHDDLLRRPGKLVVLGGFLGPVIQAALFFAAAGRLDLPRGWLYVGVSFVWMVGNVVTLAIISPEMLNYRGRRRRKDTKAWDRSCCRSSACSRWRFFLS